jgi:hypothetical protein
MRIESRPIPYLLLCISIGLVIFFWGVAKFFAGTRTL